MVLHSTAGTTTSNDAKAMMTNEEDDDDDRGVQIRISFHLATEYQDVVPSLHVPNDVIAVPADIHRKGLSTIINHLLDRHDHDVNNDDDDDENDRMDDKKLPTIPFEFMIGSSNKQNNNSNSTAGHRLLRSTGGIEREVRKLGLSLEEAIHVTYFPAQLSPEPTEVEQEPTLPDWISTMECIAITSSTTSAAADRNITSLLCVGCYDGSIVVADATTRVTSNNGVTATSRNSTQSRTNDSDSAADVPLSIMATKPLAHDGPIHCLSTTKYNNDVYIATGSMDHSLRIHVLSNSKAQQAKQDSLYEFDDTRIIDCSVNGHTAAISSVDSIMVSAYTMSESDSKLLYVASGDYDGNVGLWEYHHNGSNNNNEMNTHEQDEPEQPSSSKKSKTTTSNAPRNGKSDLSNATTASMKTISTKTLFRAHASKVSGITFGNYEKVQSSSASSSFIPQQLITGSWDHSIKVWDLERQDNISTINGQRVITCLDTSYHTSGIVVSGHPDCTIRLWDTRTTTTSSSNSNKDTSSITVSDTTLKPSHKEWVSGVKWSPTNPYHIVSTSYDGTMKLWDIRTSLPLYTIRTFPAKEKGLSVCYSSWNDASTYLFAGGTDCIVKKYKLK